MGTPDRTPGPSIEEETQYEDRAVDGNPTIDGAVRRVGDALLFKKSSGVVDLTVGGSGISEATHRTLRQLIHFIDNGPAEGFVSGAYREMTGTVFPTAVIWYDDNTKVDNKIVEKNITYTGVLPTTIEWKMYDTDGTTVLATITDAITYSGVFETSRTRTIA